MVVSPSDLTYEIWSDGACANKTTGAGGYAAVLVARRSDGSTAKQWEVFGGALDTTNNQMELKAVITGLRDTPAPGSVCIFIDSTYVMENFRDRLKRWQGNGWRTADRKDVKNRDLWEELTTEAAPHKVDWVKVAGHTGEEWNEYADQLACAQRDAYAERSRQGAVDRIPPLDEKQHSGPQLAVLCCRSPRHGFGTGSMAAHPVPSLRGSGSLVALERCRLRIGVKAGPLSAGFWGSRSGDVHPLGEARPAGSWCAARRGNGCSHNRGARTIHRHLVRGRVLGRGQVLQLEGPA